MTEGTVAVTQADRDAAAELIAARPTVDNVDIIRHGGADDSWFVQAFARHRLATEQARSDFQSGVDAWMDACFGEPIKSDQLERADRFTEEALELAQTIPEFSKERAHALVDYVFNRPQGEINQEVGGVMVTLAALCNATGVRINEAAETELARVWTKVEQIRAKQAAKPTGSALPIEQARSVQDGEAELRYLLVSLARAEAYYRSAHDLFGADDIRTGRAWDTMRRCGDDARAALESHQQKKS